MFNLIAICVTFPLLTYTAYVDVTRKDHLIPDWPWFILALAGGFLLAARIFTWNILSTFTALYGIIFTFLVCLLLRKIKDPEGNPQLGGADVKAFICLALLFPGGLTPIWIMLYSVCPFAAGMMLRLWGRFYAFLPFILGALPFAIITGMILF